MRQHREKARQRPPPFLTGPSSETMRWRDGRMPLRSGRNCPLSQLYPPMVVPFHPPRGGYTGYSRHMAVRFRPSRPNRAVLHCYGTRRVIWSSQGALVDPRLPPLLMSISLPRSPILRISVFSVLRGCMIDTKIPSIIDRRGSNVEIAFESSPLPIALK